MASSLNQMRTRLGAVMAAAPPGLAAANQLCTACVDLLGVDGAAVSMVIGGQQQGTYGSSSAASRRLDEYQFTFGEGPCLDAAATRQAVLVADLNSPHERRWPLFAGEVLGDGIRAVFALPVSITSVCVGALDLFRAGPGPLHPDQLAGGLLAAELASLPLLDLLSTINDLDEDTGDHTAGRRGAAGRGGAHSGGDAAAPDAGDERRDAVDDGRDGWASLAELDRVEVYQATGMLIMQLEVGAAEALARLRAHAVATGQTASDVAWAIVHGRLQLDRDEHQHRPGHPGDGDDSRGPEGAGR